MPGFALDNSFMSAGISGINIKMYKVYIQSIEE